MILITGRGRFRGYVLLMVLWISIALTLGIASLLSQTRKHALLDRAETGILAADVLAENALHLALAYLAIETNRDFATPLDGAPIAHRFPNGTAIFRVQDEKGKIDLAHASERLLRETLMVLAPVGEFDAFHAANMAERLVKDRKDRTVGKLNTVDVGWILAQYGLNEPAQAYASRFFTVLSFSGRVNARHADPTLLQQIPGLGPADVARILKKRNTGEAFPRFGTADEWLDEANGSTYTVIAEGHVKNGPVRRLRVLVARQGRSFFDRRPYYAVVDKRLLP